MFQESNLLDWNIAALNLTNFVIQNLTRVFTTILRFPLDSNGSLITDDSLAFGFQYNITIFGLRPNYLGTIYQPEVLIVSSDPNETPNSSVVQAQPPKPIIGNFNLEYNGTLITNISIRSFCPTMLSYLEILPDYNNDFECIFQGNLYENHDYVFKFANLKYFPSNLIINDSALEGGLPGTKPNISIIYYSNASNNSFHSPIPADWLFVKSIKNLLLKFNLI